MIVNRDREKLINAMIYFVQHTKHCHTLKLFKLLNFLDFEHFRQTGRPVTGQTYFAWEKGPVPKELWKEICKGGGDDLEKSLSIVQHKDDLTGKDLYRELKPKTPFNKALFSKREMEILERLAFYFADSKAEDMSEFSHLKGLPWKKVFGKGEGSGKQIPYELSFDSSPIVHDAKTIDDEEFRFRNELFTGLP
jgi:uncharacterized phage-associated protein